MKHFTDIIGDRKFFTERLKPKFEFMYDKSQIYGYGSKPLHLRRSPITEMIITIDPEWIISELKDCLIDISMEIVSEDGQKPMKIFLCALGGNFYELPKEFFDYDTCFQWVSVVSSQGHDYAGNKMNGVIIRDDANTFRREVVNRFLFLSANVSCNTQVSLLKRGYKVDMLGNKEDSLISRKNYEEKKL